MNRYYFMRMLSRKFRQFPIWEIILIVGVIFGFFLITGTYTAILVLNSEGEGVIIQQMNRSGANSGLFVKVKDGTEIRIPPTEIWQIALYGGHICKKKWSFIYEINGVQYHALQQIIRSALFFWLIIALPCVIVRLVVWFFKKDY